MKDSYIKFILATVIFGTNGIIASHIPLSSYEIVLCRTVLGGTFLLILALCRHEWRVLITAPRSSLVWLVLSGIFLSGNWLFLYEAYKQIGVSLATLMCYCGPVLIMILSRFIFHEPFTLPKVSGMIIVTFGMICINGADFQANGLSWGLVCGLLCALCFALLIVAMKKNNWHRRNHVPCLPAAHRLRRRRSRDLYHVFRPGRTGQHFHCLHSLSGPCQYGRRLLLVFFRYTKAICPDRFYLWLYRALDGSSLIGPAPRRSPDHDAMDRCRPRSGRRSSFRIMAPESLMAAYDGRTCGRFSMPRA